MQQEAQQRWFEPYKVDVPEGEQGDWKVQRFEVSPQESERTKFNVVRSGRGLVAPGTYTKLRKAGFGLVMSDTPDEISDHLSFIRRAKGSVLIHGLGIGMCLAAVAAKPQVTHVLCVEVSEDVLALVAPHYRAKFGDKVEIRQGDAFTWKPGKGQRWDVVWHDIWPDLNEDNLPEMAQLHRRFGRRCGWQGSWGRELLLDRKRRREGR